MTLQFHFISFRERKLVTSGAESFRIVVRAFSDVR